ncbi:hypothetical protein [Shinella sp.]|uniref:hypothetical protein n=1 Tax=Shinella sp. TaxID=1870904 RepID=UPI00301CFCB5
MSEKCAIWQSPTLSAHSDGGPWLYDSPRGGGRYSITGSASETVRSLSNKQKSYLTTWLVEQRRLGVAEPTVTTDEVSRFKNGVPRSIVARRDSLLKAILDHSSGLGETVDYSGPKLPYILAETESLQMMEVSALVSFCKSDRLLSEPFKGQVALTFDGHSRLEELSLRSSSATQAFVAMWFGSEVAAAYREGIEPAIIEAGYKPMRIDQKEHNNKIDDEIIAEIRRSRFLVADFTCGLMESGGTLTAIPRGGVYYEAGFAQGLGIPVIWCCREDHIGHVHFDTRQFNHITWKTPEELRGKLRNRIGAVLGDGPFKV